MTMDLDRKPLDIAAEIDLIIGAIGHSDFTNMYCTNAETIKYWDLSKRQHRGYFKQRGYLANATAGEAAECRLGVYYKWFLMRTSVSSLIVVSDETFEVEVLKEADLF